MEFESDRHHKKISEFSKPSENCNNFGLHVEKLNITSDTLVPVPSFLSCLNPENLEAIRIYCDNLNKVYISKIKTMEHWKNAKELLFSFIPEWFPIENLFHAREFTVLNMKIRRDHMETIRDVLLKTPTFESCSLSTDIDVPYPYPGYPRDEDNALDMFMDEVLEVLEADAEKGSNYYCVDNSLGHFQIDIDRDQSEESLFVDIKKTEPRAEMDSDID